MRALREELAGTVLMNKELLEKLEVVRQGELAESEVFLPLLSRSLAFFSPP